MSPIPAGQLSSRQLLEAWASSLANSPASRGARVVGIAGREEKCRYVVDELASTPASPTCRPASRRTSRPPAHTVGRLFENVGGKVFKAVLPLFNPGARMTICSLIAHYGEDLSVNAGAEEKARAEARRMRVQNLAVGD
ncbi:hypothetical protein KIP88_40945 [Bradyrhizobium sp. SRL28]|uniref:hypothetical protein n=1 Tax=Bradyrhizobium sp. SRL28 TaxID=2836178 RepID=UPI001BDE177D|nr:hypothetical protein [Bradyrhizobium sp. SRL28]MBT1516775.1 hypothetical protein [Bradyrhizobium sp. SRL28]